jgi:hypothetical protein
MQGFKKFQELLKLNYSASQMGFNVGAGEINRIGARVKLATAFKKLELDGYAHDTADAYSSLFKIFLMYSAFEQFLKIFDIKFYDIDHRFPDHQYIEISNSIRSKDAPGKFFDFIHEHLDSQQLKTRISDFQSCTSSNPAVLAAAIRHVFAHGKLTPNANKGNPKVAIGICALLSDFLLNFMDVEFEKSVNRFYEEQEQKGLRRRVIG